MIKLRPEIYPLINTVNGRIAIAGALKVGEAAIKKAIKNKSDVLTKIAAIEAIKTITGITDQEKLVMEVQETEAA